MRNPHKGILRGVLPLTLAALFALGTGNSLAYKLVTVKVTGNEPDWLGVPLTNWWKVRMSQLPSEAALSIHVRTVSMVTLLVTS